VRVAGVHFAPSGATVGSSGISLGDAAAAHLEPSKRSVWAGEVLDLKYSIDAATSYYPSWGRSSFEWDSSPLVTEDWSQPEPFQAGERTGLRFHTRAMAPSAGYVKLNPTSQLINLSVGVSGFGFFQQRQYQQFAVPDSPVTLDVRPLPAAPSGFTGAVGDFKITSKIVPVEVKTGEPITWTIELTGSGNWPQVRGLPTREAPADFQVIQPKPKRTQAQGKLFEGTLSEDVVLVPTREGSYELPPVDFTFFDPVSGTYKTVTAPGGKVEAQPAASAAAAPQQTAAAPGVPSVTTAAPTTEAKAPEQPTSGLGDPVTASGHATLPIRKRTVAVACAVPFALLGLLWCVLAYRSARRTDPLKPKRDARKRLAVTLDALASAPAAERTGLLLSWQKDSAILWGIESAAPPASKVTDPGWSRLWAETDRYLYSSEAVLPADWVERARTALGKKTLRSFSPATLLLPRNLFPAAALALLLAGASLRAEEPAAVYRSGHFPQAEKDWAAQVAANPADWAARHNLSLALAQQDRWGEAAAEAAAAFVQNPSDPATRRQMIVSGDKAGFVPEPLDMLIQAGPLQSLARLQSPGCWQVTGVACCAILALCLALVLLFAYRVASRTWAAPLSAILFTLSVIGGVASLVGYRAYGTAANTRAAIVWRTGTLRSVPTEADSSQKTIPLAAGSIGVADRSFLRWTRLSFPNGQTGWILDSEAIYLWTQPPSPPSGEEPSSAPSAP
jgi:hypothetical protein